MMKTTAITRRARWVALGLLLAGRAAWAAPQAGDREISVEKRKQDSTNAEKKEMRNPEDGGAAIDTQQSATTSPSGFRSLEKDFLLDQKQIWTSPARLRFSDTQWLVPLSGITAGLFVTDRDFSKHLSQNPSTLSHYKTLSDAGLGALVGGAGGMWLLGHARHDEHWSETGFLAGEAALNSLVMVESLKYSLRRERPFQGNGSGSFFQSGGTSFPSEHAAAAWSVAGIVAHEYPGPLTKIFAYGLASLVDVSRVKSRQHFSSDVLIGSVIGNLIAQNIYSRHHDPSLGGGEWRSISQIFRSEEGSSPANHGSPYVPLDSWIYPALDRLAGLGLIDSGFAGMRPWTRRECARLLGEAEETSDAAGDVNPEVQKLLSALERELNLDTESAGLTDAGGQFRLESLYSRTEHISGAPITNGFYLAQTQINDFGRPYGEGWSTVNGFSAYGTWGHWVAYVRGEAQTAPGAPPLSLSVRERISALDGLPLPPATSQPSVSQFELLDSYVGLAESNWQVTFGRQSLWWGPGNGGPMMFSDNIEPINMFRINRVSPFKLPSILGWLGPMRVEFFFGQKAGSQFVDSPSGLVGQWGQSLDQQPFIHGQKISFKPTPNFEFSVSRTVTYGGPGYPLTWHTFLRSMFSAGNESITSHGGSAIKPGDRRSGVDLSYRLPGMRNWLTFYADGFSDDEISPIAYADRSVWHSGLYFTQFPRLSHLDLRVEGLYSDNPLGGAIGPGFFYSNVTWRDGYTNNGNLIGSWIGRAGQGAQAWTNYWFGARNRLQFNFRHQKVSQQFMPGGGSLTDFGVRGDYSVRRDLSLSVSVQNERWLFPAIQPNVSRNVAATVQILFEPHKLFHDSAAGKLGDLP